MNDAYREIENHYKHFYQLNIFDWWFIPKDKADMLTPEEKLNQDTLDAELDFIVKGILKRVNRFDFETVKNEIFENGRVQSPELFGPLMNMLVDKIIIL